MSGAAVLWAKFGTAMFHGETAAVSFGTISSVPLLDISSKSQDPPSRAATITYSAAVVGVSKSLTDRGADGAEFDAAFSLYLASLQEVSWDRGNAVLRAPWLFPSRGRVGEWSLGGRGSIGG